MKLFVNYDFLWCRSLDGAVVVGSGRLPERPRKDRAARWMRKDWSWQCAGTGSCWLPLICLCEIYAYPMFLQQLLAPRHDITFFCMDVVCKYWPYLQRVSTNCPELQPLQNMRPFLSVVHAKAHDFKCEVGIIQYMYCNVNKWLAIL